MTEEPQTWKAGQGMMNEESIKKALWDAYWKYMDALNGEEVDSEERIATRDDEFAAAVQHGWIELKDLEGNPAEGDYPGFQGMVWQLRIYEEAQIVLTGYFESAWAGEAQKTEAQRMKYAFCGVEGEEHSLMHPFTGADNL